MKLGSDRASDIKTREQLDEFENIVDVYIVDIEGDVLVFQLLLKYIGDEVIDVELHADGFFNLGRADKRENTCKEVVNNNAQTVCVDEVDKLGNESKNFVNRVCEDLVYSCNKLSKDILNECVSVGVVGFEVLNAECFEDVAETVLVAGLAAYLDKLVIKTVAVCVNIAGSAVNEEGVAVAEKEPAEELVERSEYLAKTCDEVIGVLDCIGSLAAVDSVSQTGFAVGEISYR